MKPRERIEVLKDTIQEAIDQGATTVEEIHQHVAALPLNVIEDMGILGDKPGQLRDFQEQTIGAVYAAIRKINGEVGHLISEQFGNLENLEKVSDNLKARDDKNA